MMFKRLCLPLLILWLAFTSTSCQEILLAPGYIVASVGVSITEAIKDIDEAHKAWNSYPPPYRQFLTAKRMLDIDWKDYQDYYRQLVELLKQHSLTQEDYENQTAKNLLGRLRQSSRRTLDPGLSDERTARDNEPFIDMLLDDAEFFLDHPGPDDLNSMIAYAILSGAFMDSAYVDFYYSPGYRLSYLAPVRGDQRYRLAELLLRAADKLIIRDPKFEFEAGMLVPTLWIASQVSPGESRRAAIRDQLTPYLRGCLVGEIPCGSFTLDLAFATFFFDPACDEDEKMRLFRQATAHYQANRLPRFTITEAPVVMELLAEFSLFENQIEVLSKLVEMAPTSDSMFARVRAIPYYFLLTTKDRRWGEMAHALMQGKARHYNRIDIIPLVVYEAEIAMLQGDIAKSLQLRAQYVLDYVWGDDYVGCVDIERRGREHWSEEKEAERVFKCFRNPNGNKLLIDIPYISADGQFIDFSWDKPLTYYSRNGENNWQARSTLSPAQIVEEFYVNIKGCVLPGPSGRDRKPASQERQCVNRIAQAMASGSGS